MNFVLSISQPPSAALMTAASCCLFHFHCFSSLAGVTGDCDRSRSPSTCRGCSPSLQCVCHSCDAGRPSTVCASRSRDRYGNAEERKAFPLRLRIRRLEADKKEGHVSSSGDNTNDVLGLTPHYLVPTRKPASGIETKLWRTLCASGRKHRHVPDCR